MKKKTISPNMQELKREIICHWNILCAALPEDTADKVTPCPAQWPLKKVLQWLEDHPIDDSCDREYLLKAIDERVETAKAADAQRAQEQAQFNKKWIGPAPILRLIHTLIDHDEIKRRTSSGLMFHLTAWHLRTETPRKPRHRRHGQ